MLLHLFWIVPLVLSIAFLSSPRFRGDIAQRRTRRILSHGLEKNRYTILDDVVLPAGGGSVLIDHVVVSRYGVFVITSRQLDGMISGGEFQDRWKQERWGRITRFDNPMHENAVQAESLGRLLNLPMSKIHPLVVLSGHRGLKTPAPDHLVPAEQLIAYIRKKGTGLLEPEQANRVLKALEEARLRTSGKSRISRWSVLNAALVIVLLTGLWLVFGDQLKELQNEISQDRAQQESPELFHPDGSRKTEQEVWEDSLICAWSSDTGRCACYEPGGKKVDIERSRCRTLAERGSILNR